MSSDFSRNFLDSAAEGIRKNSQQQKKLSPQEQAAILAQSGATRDPLIAQQAALLSQGMSPQDASKFVVSNPVQGFDPSVVSNLQEQAQNGQSTYVDPTSSLPQQSQSGFVVQREPNYQYTSDAVLAAGGPAVVETSTPTASFQQGEVGVLGTGGHKRYNSAYNFRGKDLSRELLNYSAVLNDDSPAGSKKRREIETRRREIERNSLASYEETKKSFGFDASSTGGPSLEGGRKLIYGTDEWIKHRSSTLIERKHFTSAKTAFENVPGVKAGKRMKRGVWSNIFSPEGVNISTEVASENFRYNEGALKNFILEDLRRSDESNGGVAAGSYRERVDAVTKAVLDLDIPIQDIPKYEPYLRNYLASVQQAQTMGAPLEGLGVDKRSVSNIKSLLEMGSGMYGGMLESVSNSVLNGDNPLTPDERVEFVESLQPSVNIFKNMASKGPPDTQDYKSPVMEVGKMAAVGAAIFLATAATGGSTSVPALAAVIEGEAALTPFLSAAGRSVAHSIAYGYLGEASSEFAGQYTDSEVLKFLAGSAAIVAGSQAQNKFVSKALSSERAMIRRLGNTVRPEGVPRQVATAGAAQPSGKSFYGIGENTSKSIRKPLSQKEREAISTKVGSAAAKSISEFRDVPVNLNNSKSVVKYIKDKGSRKEIYKLLADTKYAVDKGPAPLKSAAKTLQDSVYKNGPLRTALDRKVNSSGLEEMSRIKSAVSMFKSSAESSNSKIEPGNMLSFLKKVADERMKKTIKEDLKIYDTDPVKRFFSEFYNSVYGKQGLLNSSSPTNNDVLNAIQLLDRNKRRLGASIPSNALEAYKNQRNILGKVLDKSLLKRESALLDSTNREVNRLYKKSSVASEVDKFLVSSTRDGVSFNTNYTGSLYKEVKSSLERAMSKTRITSGLLKIMRGSGQDSAPTIRFKKFLFGDPVKAALDNDLTKFVYASRDSVERAKAIKMPQSFVRNLSYFYSHKLLDFTFAGASKKDKENGQIDKEKFMKFINGEIDEDV